MSLDVKSLGTSKQLLLENEYKKQSISYGGNSTYIFSNTLVSEKNTVSITFELPFMIEETPSISMHDCYVAKYGEGIWKPVSNPVITEISNNIVRFNVTCDNDLELYGHYYLLLQSGIGNLTFTW